MRATVQRLFSFTFATLGALLLSGCVHHYYVGRHPRTVVIERPSRTVVVERPSRTVVVEKTPRTVVVEKPSRTVVVEKPSRTVVVEKPSRTVVVEKPSRTVVKKPSRTVVEKPSRKVVVEKRSRTVAAKRPTQKVVVEKQGPPPSAPANGYRHKHQGVELEFDSGLGVYVVVGHPGYYFQGTRFYHQEDGSWLASASLNGSWVAVSARGVPAKLRAKHAKKERQQGGVPAKHAR